MKNKLIGIFVMMLMIATVFLPIVGSMNVESNGIKGSPFIKKLIQGRENLAPNPSFEERYGDEPKGWGASSQGEYIWDSTDAHFGEKSIGLTELKRPYMRIAWITKEYIPVDLTENIYEYWVWYKYIGEPSESQYARLSISTADENHNYMGHYVTKLDFSSEWTLGKFNTSVFFPDWINKTKYVKLQLEQVDYNTSEDPNPSVIVRFDDVFFGIGENNPPYKPDKPSGPMNGKAGEEYTYISSTTDPDGDYIEYWFDWGDGTNSGWIGYYDSGDTCSASHVWTEEGTFEIKVKTKDLFGYESEWSDPLSVSMPKNKPYISTPFLNFLEQYPYLFPLLRQLLEL